MISHSTFYSKCENDFNKSLLITNLPTSVSIDLVKIALEKMLKKTIYNNVDDYIKYIPNHFTNIKVANDINTNLCAGYAIVDFISHLHAKNTLIFFGSSTKLPIYSNTVYLQWYLSKINSTRLDDYHLYIGNLSRDTSEDSMINVFKFYGFTIRDIIISGNPFCTIPFKYAFIKFDSEIIANQAFNILNKNYRDVIITRQISHCYALRNAMTSYNQQNTCVFVSGLHPLTTEVDVKIKFSPFGIISSIKLYSIKQFGFVIFKERIAALASIIHMNGCKILGERLSCSWGTYNFNDNYNEIKNEMRDFFDDEYLIMEENFASQSEKSLIPSNYYNNQVRFNTYDDQNKRKVILSNNYQESRQSIDNDDNHRNETKNKLKNDLYWLNFYAHDYNDSINIKNICSPISHSPNSNILCTL